MHIPVVLLVGAFDPLDENEAQRVRADGVLKKPFVPPEPLVNLVKALLVKSAGERLVAVAVPAVKASPAAEAARSKPVQEIPAHEFQDETAEEIPVPAAILKIGEYDKPVAFGALLTVPTSEPPALDENDPIVTAARDPNLGEPAFWTRAPQTETEQPPVDEGDATEHSWGRSHSLPGMDETAVFDPIEPIELDQEAAGVRAPEVPPAEEEPAALVPQHAAAKTHEEKHEEIVLEHDTRAEVPVPEEPEIAPAATVIGWPHAGDSLRFAASEVPANATRTPQIVAEVDPEIEPPIGSEKPVVSTSADPILETTAEQAAELQARWRPESEEAPEVKAEAKPDAKEAEPKHSHDPEHEELASSWPPPFRPVTTPAEPAKAPALSKPSDLWPSLEETVPAVSVASVSVPFASKAPAPIPSATESATSLTSGLTKPALNESSPSGTLTPEMVEAVVNRIVDRMQPKVLEMLTREVLRPVVEALVRREIGKK
jgi:hypothetical protein